MAGLIGLGNSYKSQAMGGLNRASDLEYQREQANLQLEQAEKQQTMSAVGTGAGIGAMFGPVGAGIGAGVGLLAGELL